MRSFSEIERDLGLVRFAASPLGTLYFVPSSSDGPKLMVRRFDSAAGPEFVTPYAQVAEFAQLWLDERAHLGRLVRVEQPVETGSDFLARKFYVYYVSTNSYLAPDPPEVPEELEEMRSLFREEAGRSDDPRDELVERVLARSILEPNSKTVPDQPQDGSAGVQFVIIDPKLTLPDLKEWVATDRHRG